MKLLYRRESWTLVSEGCGGQLPGWFVGFGWSSESGFAICPDGSGSPRVAGLPDCEIDPHPFLYECNGQEWGQEGEMLICVEGVVG